jgi:hypothetical protein
VGFLVGVGAAAGAGRMVGVFIGMDGVASLGREGGFICVAAGVEVLDAVVSDFAAALAGGFAAGLVAVFAAGLVVVRRPATADAGTASGELLVPV